MSPRTHECLANSEPSFAAPQLARLFGFDRQGRVLVQLEADGLPLPARLALSAPFPLAAAMASHAHVLVLFEDGDRSLPIVIGHVAPPTIDPSCEQRHKNTTPSRQQAALARVASEAPQEPEHPSSKKPTLDARLNGKRLVLEAEDELVLSAGKATITLHRNGKVVVRGTYVETHASGTNRIKGAQVRVN